jgi:imidazolonepropionase-like amidohydrolase
VITRQFQRHAAMVASAALATAVCVGASAPRPATRSATSPVPHAPTVPDPSPQSAQIPAPPQSKPVLITGVTLEGVAGSNGPIANGHILFDGGRILSVGSGAPDFAAASAARKAANKPAIDAASCDTVDGSGLRALPGYISMATALGLVETLQVKATDDRAETGQFHPETRASIAINPDSDLIPVARLGGVLGAVVFPEGGLMCGQASLIRLDGWNVDDLAMLPDAGLVIRWPATEPAPRWATSRDPDRQEEERVKALRSIDSFVEKAKAYVAARDADPTIAPDVRYERMRTAMRGETPVFIEASSAGQVESAVLWATRHGMRPVIVGGQGAPEVADLLRSRDVPVVVSGVMRLPRFEHEPYDAPYTLPARLAALGVRVAIATGDEPSNDRNLAQHAAMAAAYGLPRELAIAAITREPARIVGLGEGDGALGTLAPGARASIILVDGDPLDLRSHVRRAWIDGRDIELASRQTRLRDKYEAKYRQRDATAQ